MLLRQCLSIVGVIFNNSKEMVMNVKRLIVTGSSSGIGRAICEILVSKKISVIGITRNADGSELDSEYYRSHKLDLANIRSLHEKFTNILKINEDIDGLISCAGVGSFGSIENFSLRHIEDSLKINLLSHIVLTRSLIPLFKKKNSGNLIYVGSEAALEGGKQGSLYSAAKFGLRGFSQSIRAEVANKNIRVVLINPGMVRTSFFDDLNFQPGKDEHNAILVEDIAKLVVNILEMSPTTNVDEVVINPMLKRVIKKDKK